MSRFLALVKDWLLAVWQRLKDLPLWVKYAALVVLVAAVAVLLIFEWGFRKQIDAKEIARQSGVHIDHLWFLPDGRLAGRQSSLPIITIFIWDVKNRLPVPEKKEFNIDGFINFLDSYIEYRDPPDAKIRRNFRASYVITRDGERLLMLYRGYLAVLRPNVQLSPSSERLRERPLTQRLTVPLEYYDDWRNKLNRGEVQIVDLGEDQESPTALTITYNGLIALAYDDGRLQFRSSDEMRQVVGGRKTNLKNPTLIQAFGNLITLVSFPDASLVQFDINRGGDLIPRSYPPGPRLKLASSDLGRLGVSNGTNEVFLTATDGSGDANIPLKIYGIVNDLAFFDKERIVVGGGFQDVYLLEQDQLPYKMAIASRGVNAVAVNSNRLAYADVDGVVLLWHTNRRVLNKIGWVTIIAFGLFFLTTAAFYVYDNKEQRETAFIPPVSLSTTHEDRRLPVPDVPPALVKAFRDGECVLYSGSGVSAQAGFPYWQPFVSDLTEWSISSGFVPPELSASLKEALAQRQYDSVSDNLVSIMRDRQPQLNDYLSGVFLRKATLPESVKLLKSLPFSAAMTTNFDNLLEEAFADKSTSSLTPTDADLLLQRLHNREFFLLKLYGKLEQPPTVMLAPSQYDDVIKGNLVFSNFMETLLISRTVFFVGSSLEGIQAYLKGMPLPRQRRKTHYALVPVSDEAWHAKANPLKERYGIEVLPYSPSDGHPELLSFLQNLNAQVQETSEGDTERVDQATVLKKISVTDIGPFENLELNLDPHWNILLGDNGVGKSSIIKAIAIAILGEDSRSYAQRIIKVGQPNSVITLESGRATYTTKLYRKNGEARVESIPGRAFEAEGWLAVGFPPLRTVSSFRPRSAETGTTGRERPTTDDLLPIVVGDVDPRLDKLKQWIVNVDYRIKDARVREQDPTPYERLLKDLFNVVAQLTPGAKIEFNGVNPENKEITVTTDDGEVPIELLSQGMISLIGWVGILLQRLYEVYGKDDDPKQRYALILMDEIDAHLHPAWQQSLIRTLSKIFPNAQFIATTHSPLIVGGMKPEQIIRFARDENHNVVTYAITEEMTVGRADQILSSDLFGLESTMKLNEDLEVLMEEYDDLIANEERNDKEEHRFRELRKILKTRIPLVSETPAEQKAMGLLEALLDTDGDGEYRTVDNKLLGRAQALLDEVGKKRK